MSGIIWVPESYNERVLQERLDTLKQQTPLNIPDCIDAFVAIWDHAQFGPAHIVLGDYNIYDGHIDWCLSEIAAGNASDHDKEELAATAEFLNWLKSVPEEVREASLCEHRPYMCEDD